MTRASLASSDGWMRNGPPKSIQLRLPLTSVPANTTRHSNAITAIRPTYADARHTRTGSREATIISGRPMTTHIACLATMAYDEPNDR